MKHGKRYRAILEGIDAKKEYSLEEAIDILQGAPKGKFDESVELHIRLGIDPKKNDQQVRGTVVLPSGTGKTKKVAVITSTKTAEAKSAAADVIGGEEMVADIAEGKLLPGTHFDVLLSTPEMMPKLAKVAKILGPKGLMPNPKNETVTVKIAEAVEALKKGSKASFKADDSGNAHQAIGKISFTKDALLENAKTFMDTLTRLRPGGVKGNFILSATIATTMSPGIRVKF